MVARWIIEECDLGAHKVHNYLSISGPQQGVQAVPECLSGEWCKALNVIADQIALLSKSEETIAPAAYYRETQNALHYKIYLA